MLYSGFKTFSEKSSLLESVQMAKDYLLKRYATEKKIKTSEIPENVKQKILNDPRFIEIKDLTAKSPGYTPLFTKFAFEQKATMEELKEIMDLLNQYKNNLAKDLEMPVLDYGKIEPSEEDHRPGYEVLGDELRNIPRRVKLRKFYSQFTQRMRKEFQKATEGQIAKLEEISNQLDRMPKKDGLDPWEEFTKTLKSYDDTRTYPEYRDPKAAFQALIDNADLFVEKWQESDDELIKKLKALGAQVGFLYNKDGYVVISTRTPEALKEVAGDSNWCIRNDSTFWSYGGGRVQLVIINKNRPASDPKSLYGITVNPDETVYTDAVGRSQSRVTSKSGSTFNGKPLKSLLESQDFPQELIDKVMKSFGMEKDIKLAMEEFFRNQASLTPQKIVSSLINVNRGFLSGALPEEDWERISGVVSEIIKGTEKLKTSAFLAFFKENGIMSASGWEVFKKVVGDDYTEKDIKEIYSSTEDGLDSMEYLLNTHIKKGVVAKASDIEKMEYCVSHRDEILGRIKTKF